jgi:hypothetical protein
MHFVFDRKYSEDFPESIHLDKYRKLLSELPDEKAGIIAQHLNNARLEFYCKCGCHSFEVFPLNRAELPALKNESGLYREIAYQTNYNKELNVLLFVDECGILNGVDVFCEAGNTEAMPDDLAVTGIEGIW